MKNNYEIVQKLKEEEKQGKLFSSRKESSNNSSSTSPAQDNILNQNLEYERFKNFFENAPVYGYLLSPEGIILEVNKMALTSLEYEKEDLIGKHLNTVCAPKFHKKMNNLLLKWKETDEIDNEEMVFVTKQGENRTVLLSVNSVRDTDGKIMYFISIQKNVTEINRINDELNKNLESQNINLQQLNEVKTTFLKTTSHELRTPITSIKGYIQMLLKQILGEINEEQRKSLEIILRNINRLDRIIQNILDVSNLKSGTMKFIPSKVNPRILVEEITKATKSFAYEREITINVDLEKDLPDLIVDRERVKQVLKNLVDNAIKFSPGSSIINIKAKKENEDVLFEVQDFGQGIPKDKQEQIFDGFYQVDSSEVRKFDGVGLSLALSKGIILSHGGNIWVESTEGKGSTFWFTLPIKSIYNIENTYLKNDISPDMHKKSVYFVADTLTRNTTGEYANHPITEHEKIKEAFKESEERYRALFNSSFELIYLHDFKGNFIDANPAAFKLFGYDKEKLTSINFSSLLDKGQHWKAIKTVREIKKYGHQKEPMEYRVKTKNGTFVDIETTAEMLYRNGKPYAIQGMARDITKRKKAEGALVENQEKYRLITENTNDLIIVTNIDKTFFYVSPSIKSLGYTPDELIGQDSFFLLHPEDKISITSMLKQLVIGMYKPGTSSRFEYRLRDKSGVYHIYEATAKLVKDESGKHHIISISRDITDRKKMEESLRQSEEKFRQLFNSSPELIIESDEEGNILAVNSTMAKSLGTPVEKLIGKSIFDILPREIAEERAKIARKALEEMKNLECDDERAGRYFQNIYVPIINPDGKRTIQLIARDFTAQKKAEITLKESEERFRLLFNDAPVSIALVDKDGIIKEVNNNLLRLLSIQKEEIVGKNFVQLTSAFGLDAKENIKDFSNRLAEKPPKREITFLNRNKSETTINVQSTVIKSGNEIIGVLFYIEDVTERKQAEEALKKSENRYRASIELTQLLAWTTSDIGEIIEDIPIWRKFTGQSYEEAKGTGWTKAIHPDDLKHTLQLWKKAVETKNIYEVEYRVRRYDGIFRSFLTRGIPVLTEGGGIKEWVGICIDITERKIIEKELKESEEKYRNVVERASDGIVIIQNMIIMYVNPRAFEILGYKPSEILGTSMTAYIHPDELPNVVEYYNRRIEGDYAPITYESILVHKDGRGIYVELSGRAIIYQGKPADMIMVHDITERKKVEKELREKMEELKRFKKLTIERELKMIELKIQIKKLEENLKELPSQDQKFKENLVE